MNTTDVMNAAFIDELAKIAAFANAMPPPAMKGALGAMAGHFHLPPMPKAPGLSAIAGGAVKAAPSRPAAAILGSMPPQRAWTPAIQGAATMPPAKMAAAVFAKFASALTDAARAKLAPKAENKPGAVGEKKAAFSAKDALKGALEEGGPALGATLGAGVAAGFGKSPLSGAAMGYGVGALPELLHHKKK